MTFSLNPSLSAQQAGGDGVRENVYVKRFSTPITLDGVPDEEQWESTIALPLVVFEPVYQAEMTERTEIKVAYDESYLYVSGKIYHEQLSDIRLNSLYRDRYSNDDTFAIIIDSFNDDENALWFFINPAGVRFDVALSNDGDFSAGNVFNSSWNTFWDAKTVMTDFGWTAEIRIPFSSIGLKVKDNQAEIGIIAYRYFASNSERHLFPDIPPNWPLANAKPSKAYDVVLEDVQFKKPFYFTPYFLGGVNRSHSINASETEFTGDQDLTHEVGFDLRYNLNPSTTIEGTFNTDFAQVEADDQQINLSRFPLFFPEKRQFFQERASIFTFGLGGRSTLFFSRRIGLDPTGQPIRIWGGSRVTSKMGQTDIGILNMQTADSDNLPSENFGVYRIRSKVFNKNSYVGGILTSRLSPDSYNYATGIDGIINLFGNDFLTARYAHTFDDQRPHEQAGFLFLEWTNRKNNGLFYNASFSKAEKNFNPGIGFLRRQDFYSFSGGLSYAKLFEVSGLRRLQIGLSGNSFLRNADHSTESSGAGLSARFEFINEAQVNVDVNYSFEDLERDITLVNRVDLTAGSYSYWSGRVRYEMAPFNLLRSNFTVTGGQFFDGHSIEVSASPTWNVSKYLELGGDYIMNHLDFSERGQNFTSHIIRFRAEGALNKQLSLSNYTQFSNVSSLVGLNFRLRYNLAEGRDLWLVYNEQMNTDLESTRYPNATLPRSDSRVILLKFSYALNLAK